MPRRLIILIVCLTAVSAACSTGAEPASTTAPPATTTTTTAVTTTTTSQPGLEPCPPPTFLPTVLPDRVVDDQPSPAAVPLDAFTLQPGTLVTGWTDDQGEPVLVIVRGDLPPRQWIATPEKIEVRGVEAALGDLGEGIWGVAWFEGPDRCDDYYLVFYPPTGPDEARAVAMSLTGSA